jgi:acid stress chaperone HdeB
MTLKELASAALFGVLVSSGAQSQVMIDVSKITCDQLTLYKITDPENIALWLSGYYEGKRNSTLVDIQRLNADTEKIKTFCRMNPNVTVMQAIDRVLGPLK